MPDAIRVMVIDSEGPGRPPYARYCFVLWDDHARFPQNIRFYQIQHLTV